MTSETPFRPHLLVGFAEQAPAADSMDPVHAGGPPYRVLPPGALDPLPPRHIRSDCGVHIHHGLFYPVPQREFERLKNHHHHGLPTHHCCSFSALLSAVRHFAVPGIPPAARGAPAGGHSGVGEYSVNVLCLPALTPTKTVPSPTRKPCASNPSLLWSSQQPRN